MRKGFRTLAWIMAMVMMLPTVSRATSNNFFFEEEETVVTTEVATTAESTTEAVTTAVTTEASTEAKTTEKETAPESTGTESSQTSLEEVKKMYDEGMLTLAMLIYYVEYKGLNLDDFTKGTDLEGITLEELMEYEGFGFTVDEAMVDYKKYGSFDPFKISTDDDNLPGVTSFLGRTTKDSKIYGGVLQDWDVGKNVDHNIDQWTSFKSDSKAKEILNSLADRDLNPIWKIYVRKEGNHKDSSGNTVYGPYGSWHAAYCLDSHRSLMDTPADTYKAGDYQYFRYDASNSEDSESISGAKRKRLKVLYYFIDKYGDNEETADRLFAQIMTWAIMNDSSLTMAEINNIISGTNTNTLSYKSGQAESFTDGANKIASVIDAMTAFTDEQKTDYKKQVKTLYNNYRVLESSPYYEDVYDKYIKDAVSLQFYKNKKASQRLVAYQVKDTRLKIFINKVNKAALTNGNTLLVNGPATYKIYQEKACTTEIGTISIKENGKSETTIGSGWGKKAGNDGYVYIKETKAPDGYLLDTKVYKVSLFDLANVSSRPILAPENAKGMGVSCSKYDEETGVKISGATIELQEWSANNNSYVAIGNMSEIAVGTFSWKGDHSSYYTSIGGTQHTTLLGGGEGRIYYTSDNQGKFRLIETKAPVGYELDSTPREFNINDYVDSNGNQIKACDFSEFHQGNGADGFTDTQRKFSLKIMKVCTVSGETKPLSGATFTVYEYNPATGTYINGRNMVESTSEPGNYSIDGLVYSTNNPRGFYKVEETKAPYGYDKAGWYREFELGDIPNPTIEYYAQNSGFSANVLLTKTNASTKELIEDAAEFSVYPWVAENNSYNTKPDLTLTKGANGEYTGKLEYTYSNLGKFKIVETSTPSNAYIGGKTAYVEIDMDKKYVTDADKGYKYDADKDVYYVLVDKTAVLTSNIDTEEVTDVEIDKTKVVEKAFDNEVKEVSIKIHKVNEKDEPLSNAVFGVYAGEDLYNPSKSIVIYPKDTLITELKTDKGGNASVKIDTIYRNCKLYVQEIEAPEHYEIDTTKNELDVVFMADKDEVVIDNLTVENKFAPHPATISLTKTTSTTKEPIADKADFKVYPWVESEKDYSKTPEFSMTQGEKGEYTGSLNYTLTNIGKYKIVEEATPGNAYVGGGPVYVEVDIYGKYVKDEDLEKGFVYDAEKNVFYVSTNKTAILSQEYKEKVEDSSKEEATTEKDSTESTEETSETTEATSETTTEITTEESTDENVFLDLSSVTPVGNSEATEATTEAAATETTPTESTTMDSNGFEVVQAVVDKDLVTENGFENKPKEVVIRANKVNEKNVALEGAVFGVFAGEDLYNPTNTVVIYPKDSLIATMATGKDGKASVTLNTIYRNCKLVVKEIKAPERYTINVTENVLDVVFEADKDKVEFEEITVVDELKPLKIKVLKKDARTDIPLKGVEFTIYDPEGKELEVITTNELGEAESQNEYTIYYLDDNGNVQVNPYSFKETKALNGYVVDDISYTFDMDVSKAMVDDTYIYYTVYNTPTLVEISKTSLTTGVEISGALLTIYNSEDKVVASWITNGEPLTLEALAPGQYRLVEERAPFGYIIAEEVVFTVENTTEIQKVEMKDAEAVGKLTIYKHDANDDDLPLEGVEFEIRSMDGKVIETLVTDEHGYAESSELPFATFGPDGSYQNVIQYILVETKTVDNYILDDEERVINFSYINDTTPVIELRGDIGNESKPDSPKEGTPGTGETAFFIIALIIAILSAIGAIFYFKKRKIDDILGRK